MLTAPTVNAPKSEVETSGCFHCGTPLRSAVFSSHEKSFCCGGCLTVFELLTENGLDDFYRYGRAAGIRAGAVPDPNDFSYLNEPALRRKLVDFSDDRTTRVTFRLPAIHCIACVWLLENLFRLNPGVGYSRVNFPRKEVFITFDNARVRLSEVVALLASLGYAPDLNLSDAKETPRQPVSRRLWLQMGVAGFAFGNIMLLSISSYLGLDAFAGPALKNMFGIISLLLATPVLIYSAADYWKAAWVAWKRRIFTVDVPIAIGLAAFAGWSGREVFTAQGPGYFDSLSGLIFFLLCGRMFQQKTYDRLAFDRDYKSFFPLSILRQSGFLEKRVSLAHLKVGDHLIIRNGELIPADARLISGPATIDYSFVTGESEPVPKSPGDHIYAGGRQMGGVIHVETVKEVSQSYLTSLWNQDTLVKERKTFLDSLTNQYSFRFTKIVLVVAFGALAYWWAKEPSRALPSFVAVLIVACPCALALAAPFALGSAQRVLGRKKVFLKNPGVLETLARVDTIVFDKTGTLTASGAGAIGFAGEPLDDGEKERVRSLAVHSTHPCAVRIAGSLQSSPANLPVRTFAETAGCGLEGVVDGHELMLGSSSWLESRGAELPSMPPSPGSVVHLEIDGEYRGCFTLSNALRPEADELIPRLAVNYDLNLLSGDNERERGKFIGLFGKHESLHFNQSPLHKLNFIRGLQRPGRTVMMVGDGLNDSGALKQSDVGVAVVESIGAFSPASDIIMSAGMIHRLPEILEFARASVRIVRASLVISGLYNIVGLSIAARGLLAPIVCAILMPLSSITVVAFACGMTAWAGRRLDVATVKQRGTS